MRFQNSIRKHVVREMGVLIVKIFGASSVDNGNFFLDGDVNRDFVDILQSNSFPSAECM